MTAATCLINLLQCCKAAREDCHRFLHTTVTLGQVRYSVWGACINCDMRVRLLYVLELAVKY